MEKRSTIIKLKKNDLGLRNQKSRYFDSKNNKPLTSNC